MPNPYQTKGEGSKEVGENIQELRDYSEVRYYYEHRLLPNWFYDKRDGVIKEISKEGSFFLWWVMVLICEEAGQEMRYREEQYISV